MLHAGSEVETACVCAAQTDRQCAVATTLLGEMAQVGLLPSGIPLLCTCIRRFQTQERFPRGNFVGMFACRVVVVVAAVVSADSVKFV